MRKLLMPKEENKSLSSSFKSSARGLSSSAQNTFSPKIAIQLRNMYLNLKGSPTAEVIPKPKTQEGKFITKKKPRHVSISLTCTDNSPQTTIISETSKSSFPFSIIKYVKGSNKNTIDEAQILRPYNRS
ncbi:hypothetical protein SteCoe_10968 [Stentor coeruleus]|uniref:Uncharacterized protein n=1 Tax=Stentor coeruleus TaxID=5963 RepID=A0A1R2CEJ4_9CILI|nr:hypothetical protein SteCoe_10968 [Stentor coeruleus]